MTNVDILGASRDQRGGYKVDVSRGERIGRVSSEWFSRPADERYLSLSELFAAVRGRAERSRTRTVETAAIHVEASRENAQRLSLMAPGSDVPLVPTHWSFGQLTSLIGAPAAYLRELPAALAGINLQFGLSSHRAELVKTLEVEDGRVELRAVTGPDYGRIYDHELVASVQRIAGDGTVDTRWKVPGVLDWSTGIYDPGVDVTRDTTTLYASDRDVFLFLVDDRRTVSPDRLVNPPSRYVVQAGAVIPAALITGIRSDLPGQVTAQVTASVYDSPSGKYLLIPQGSKLIGVYDSQISFGQDRVLLVWTRLIMPNGRSIVLERQPGADTQGFAGLEDEVDYHWGRLFAAAALSTLLGVGSELGATNNDNAIVQAIRQGSSNSLNQTGQQVVRRNLNIQPTITVRPGFPVRVIVNRDLVLAPYQS